MQNESLPKNFERGIEEKNIDSVFEEKFNRKSAEKDAEEAISAIYESSEKDFVQPVMPEGMEENVSSEDAIPNTGDVVADVKDIMKGSSLAEISDRIEKYSQEYRKK